MKKIIPLLLLLLLLGGCTAQTSPSLQAPAGEVLPNGQVVHTDYSQYSTARERTVYNGRLSPELLDTLIPSEDYGMIYPYLGEKVEAESFLYNNRYGLMDATGRILVDPVYRAVSPVQYVDENEISRPFPVWKFKKTVREGASFNPKNYYALATPDGSFVTDFVCQDIQCDGEYIACTCKETIHIYDEELTLLYSFSLEEHPELPGEIRFYILSEGVLCACVDFPYSREGSRYYYLDLDGSVLSGPYLYATEFSDGYGLAEVEEGNYIFVNKRGKLLKDRTFSEAYPFANHRGAGRDAKSGEILLFDNRGKLYFSRHSTDEFRWYGQYLEIYEGDNRCYYDKQGEPVSYPQGWEDANTYLDGRLLCDGDALYNPATGAVYTPETGNGYFEGFWNASYEEFPYLYYTRWEEFGPFSVLINEDLEEVLSGPFRFRIYHDSITGELYPVAEQVGKYTVYDTELREIFSGTGSLLGIYNERLLCEEHMCCAYYDLSGELLFCKPLNNLGED